MKQKIKGLLYIISTDRAPAASLLHFASQAIQGGVGSLQFRHKGIYTPEIFSLGHELVNLCQKASIPFIVNDRIDIALALNASGVHLGQTDLPFSAARKLLGKEKILGGTASNLAQARQLVDEGVDYIGLGHIFQTTSKHKDLPPIGLDSVQHISQQIALPIIAIGGIGAHNVNLVCAAGAHGVAVISAINNATNPYLETVKLKQLMAPYAN